MQLDLFKPAPQSSAAVTMWVGSYDVRKGETRKFYYYRFYWMNDGKTHHAHIPGGDVNHPRVRDRVGQVERLIAAGESADEICKLIRSWSEGRGSNLNRNRFMK